MNHQLIIMLLLFTGCLKTAEQVRKEQQYNEEVAEGSKNMLAYLSTRVKELEEQLGQSTGTIEQLQHEQEQIHQQAQKATDNKVEIVNLKMELENQRSQMEMLEKQVQEQSDFISEVTKSLEQMSKAPVAKASQNQNIENFSKGLEQYQKKNYDSAKKSFEQALAHDTLNNSQINIARHRLGLIEFDKKNFQTSIIHMSKIYPKWPRSSMAPDALYFIGLSLKEMGKKEEANEAFDKFLAEYPDHKWAKEIKR